MTSSLERLRSSNARATLPVRGVTLLATPIRPRRRLPCCTRPYLACVLSVQCPQAAATAIPQRADESGARYDVDVDDTSLTLAELDNGAIGTIVCSWATRVRRDDLLNIVQNWSGKRADLSVIVGRRLGTG